MCHGSFLSKAISIAYQSSSIVTVHYDDITGESTTESAIYDVSTDTYVKYGTWRARPFLAVFKQEEIPNSISSNTGDGLVHSSTGSDSDPIDMNHGLLPSSGLSIRVVAGIGVGAGLGMLFLSALGFFLYHRRSRRQKHQQRGTIEEPSNEYKSELHHEHRVELQDETVPAGELDTPDKAVCVIDNSASPVEMDAPGELTSPRELDVPKELDALEEPNAPEKPDKLDGPDLREGEQP